MGEEVDATSLTNMKQAIVWLKACNKYRASVGLGELKVTYAMMATAIADANFSDTKTAHAMQFNVGETWRGTTEATRSSSGSIRRRPSLTALRLRWERRALRERLLLISTSSMATKSIATWLRMAGACIQSVTT